MSMFYTTHKFGRNLFILEGTLLGYQSTFPAVSQLPLEGFSSVFIPRTLDACSSNYTSFVAFGY